MAHIFIFTARNEVCDGYVLHLSVILFTEGEYMGRYTRPGTRYTPGTRYSPSGQAPRTRYTPEDQVHPLGPGTPPLGPDPPPRTRYTQREQVHSLGPGTPPQDQVHPPRPGTPPGPGTPPPHGTRYNTPGTRYTPRTVHAGRYGPTSGPYASYLNAFLLGIVTLILNCFCKDAYHNHKVQFLFKLLYVLKICVQIQNLDVKSVPPDAPNSCMLSCFFTLP